MTADTYHVDGKLVPAEEATVSVRDRGFVYGDAAVETLRLYGGELFEWGAHAERLRRTCRTLGFEEAMPPAEDLRERVLETAAANDLADAAARLSITRGVQSRSLTPDPRVAPTVVVVVDGLPRGGTGSESVWDGPARLRTVGWRRPPTDSMPADVQTNAALAGVLARLELRGTDADEAVLLDADGRVTEGAASNVFFVDDGTLKTPTARLPLLAGVTRGVVLDVARGEDFPVEAGEYGVADLRRADEVFATNTEWEVRPVTAVDGSTLDVGPVTELLAQLFDERVERQHY